VAEGARLESVFTFTRNVGSNPTLSAKNYFQEAPLNMGLFIFQVKSNTPSLFV
jgi:hypothetical protein